MNELSIYEVYDLHNSVLRIVTHITDGSEIEEKVVKTMGGQLYELPSVKLQREIAEKYAEIINEKDTGGGTKYHSKGPLKNPNIEKAKCFLNTGMFPWQGSIFIMQ